MVGVSIVIDTEEGRNEYEDGTLYENEDEDGTLYVNEDENEYYKWDLKEKSRKANNRESDLKG